MPEYQILVGDVKVDMKDAIAIVAFPGIGLAAGISGEFLRKNQNLELAGFVWWKGHPAVAQVHEGQIATPITIHYGALKCEVGEKTCPNLVIISCPIDLPAEHADAICNLILEFTATSRALICLDSMKREEGDDTPDVFWAASTTKVAKLLKGLKLQPLGRSMLVGPTARLLLAGRVEGRDVGTLIVEAKEDFPDHAAAVALVKALDSLIPSVSLDATPLEEEAKKLEEMIQQLAKQSGEAELPKENLSFI